MQFRKLAGDQVRIQFDSDDAGRRGKNVIHRKAQQLGGGLTAGERHPIAGPRGAIGIAGVHQNGAGFSSRGEFKCLRARRTGAACT